MPPCRLLLVACLASALAGPTARAQGDDRTQAAEHFALAQSAESRKDWRAAIAEYQEAYKISPHPSVLFNIAVDYEHLAEYRNAATYFLRYVDGSPQADDREQTLQRAQSLRQRPSQVSFTSSPPGATIYVDGTPSGASPLTLSLPAGSHQTFAEHDGHRCTTRQIVLEYGDPITVGFDVYAQPGTLEVDTSIGGAEIRVDGNLVGYTPFAGAIAAGDHLVLISLAGYQSVQRQVTVPAQGSAQVRENLIALVGATPTPAVAATPTDSGKFMLGTGYGFHASSDAGFRFDFRLGYRSASNRVELNALFGAFGTTIQGGVGGEVRGFLGTGRLRPYLRSAVLVGIEKAFEAGGGLLLTNSYGGASPVGIEYFVDAAVQVNTGGGSSSLATPGGGATAAVSGNAVAIPIIFGIAVRIGGSN